MKLLNTLLATILSFSSFLIASQVYANDYAEQKVVYHVNVNDAKRHNSVLGNIQNHINGVGAERIDVKVVMHGAGIELLRNAKKDPQVQAKVDNLKLQGVEFKVCANTLRKKNIKIEELYDAKTEDVVTAGVAEIAALQQKGYVYLRP